MKYLFLSVFFFTGCAMDYVRPLHTGMSRNELLWDYGEPDEYIASEPDEQMHYFGRTLTPLSKGRTADYYVYLHEGTVVEFVVKAPYYQ